MFNSLENIGNIENNEPSKAKVLENKLDNPDTVASPGQIEHEEYRTCQSDSENESTSSRDKTRRRPAESLAQRAKSISRTHLTKLKSNLSVEDLAKFIPGYHQGGYDSDNTSESAIR